MSLESRGKWETIIKLSLIGLIFIIVLSIDQVVCVEGNYHQKIPFLNNFAIDIKGVNNYINGFIYGTMVTWYEINLLLYIVNKKNLFETLSSQL